MLAAVARPPALQRAQQVCLRACRAAAQSVACDALPVVQKPVADPAQVLRPESLVRRQVLVRLLAVSLADVH